ncbi:unnamed protein product [Owenia fusiformis]|uniref:Calx-beta domain-containing protein n=1 Tax=Owenia fusiformis TaxID=6347 RepID=A0A8S4PL19_OWEFU|nr:unnamed protein product [Owenia fusiformis]
MANCTIDLGDYLCSDKGLLLPFVSEYTWSKGARATIYVIGLLWCFFGIAIIADIFMCAIERITSKTRTIKVASQKGGGEYEEIEVKVWNDTVANLTLMALGSSAPEILLSIIGIIKNNFYSEELGPGTIVGSAAFNLLVISAVCITTIPSPDVRTIKSVKVFAVTAFFSIFAYIWLLIILKFITPNYVDLWEAIVTLLMFPILVILAYVADKDFFRSRKSDAGVETGVGLDKDTDQVGLTKGQVDKENMRKFLKEIGKHPDLTDEDIAALAAAKVTQSQSHDRAWYRINATREMTGGHKLKPTMNEHLKELYEDGALKDEVIGSEISMSGMSDIHHDGTKAIIEFTATTCAIMERDERVRISMRRYGKLSERVIFKVETIDGTAEAQKDFIPVKQTLVFEPSETSKYIDIEIVDDNIWEPDEVFFVKMAVEPGQNAMLGKKQVVQVTILNDDDPGTFSLSRPSYLFKESVGKALIPVERENGADGRVEVTWKTEDMCAKSGHDYEGGEGTLVFEHGETTKMIEIQIYDDQEAEKDENFKLSLIEVSPGCKMGRIQRTIVTIVNDDEFQGVVSRLVAKTNLNLDSLKVDTTTWGEQFRNAMNVNGGDVENATHLDYFMHFLTFGWKIIFAIVPPPSIAGGYLAFFISLAMIGLLTAVVGDLASIFGCLVGLEDPVTAITFVALGTSLPDLFASKTASIQEKHADFGIGNITGSNSVNVFLGLGLPWTIAAIYWTAQGKTFKVDAGSLGFSVTVFTCCAVVCLGMIILRRFVPVFGKAELGGPFGPKIASGIFLCSLWLLYIVLATLQTYKIITSPF